MVVLVVAAADHAGAVTPGMTMPPARLAKLRDEFYCQSPGEWAAGNAATYYRTEMADDIPNALIGQQISAITFYVAEWECGSWWDPQALAINFYDQACPPDSAALLHFEIPWDQLEVEVVHDGGPNNYVRKATATLPELVTIQPDMSIGGAAVNDWGFAEHGWLGLIMTAHYDVTGCEFYMDSAFQGIPRWTPGSATPWWDGIPHDLAYCLAVVPPNAIEAQTWGRVKAFYR
jgi:hypothetical protein